MNTVVLILVFVMACYVSFKAGINFGLFKLYKALAEMPDEMRKSHFDHYKQQLKNIDKEAE